MLGEPEKAFQSTRTQSHRVGCEITFLFIVPNKYLNDAVHRNFSPIGIVQTEYKNKHFIKRLITYLKRT